MQSSSLLIGVILVALLALCQSQEETLSLKELCMANAETQELCMRLLGENMPEQKPQPEKQQVDKRKASFIRFGKRSAPPEPVDMMSDLHMTDKRKASFIRFGRK